MILCKKINLSLLFVILVFFVFCIPLNSLAEVPARVFDGNEDSDEIMNNIDFTDISNSDSFAKDAIWETAALELMKSYGNRQFDLNDRLTVEEALMHVYNMAGREAEAQLAAETLDNLRTEDDRKTYAPAMWSDGYIQLSLNDGLITPEQYNDAIMREQTSLNQSNFHRNASVHREDLAFYIARVLEINPVNEQTHLFNNYSDWHNANPHRIPYIEALLQNGVMSGAEDGNFRPKGYVTKEQIAQIIKNAEPFIFPKLGMEKFKGTIEKITSYTDKSSGDDIEIKLVNVRNNSGALHQLNFSYSKGENGTNEVTGDMKTPYKGTIVNEMGVLKDEKSLSEGQQITYIVQNGKLLYVTVNKNQLGIEYKLARIFSADVQNKTVRAEILLDIPFPDIRFMDPQTLYNISSTGEEQLLSVSNNCLIYIDYVQKTLNDIKPETLMLITLENNLITSMEKVNKDLLQEGGIYSGILEENNPSLGYITLYFPDGSGTAPSSKSELSTYRTYSYLRAEDVMVYKNGNLVDIGDLSPGDSVFIKLNEEGNITKISGTDNFYPVYGKVRTKGNGILQLTGDDGRTIQLRIPLNVPVFEQRRRASYDDIAEGDEVRILLQTSGNQTVIGEITIKKEETEANGIFKAQLANYDDFSKSIVVSGMQQFKDGIWNHSDIRGARKLDVNDNYNPDIPRGAHGTIYLATGENMMGNDTVIRLALENKGLSDEIISDTIVQAEPGRGRITLMNRNIPIQYDESSLIIKGGKLLEPNQIKNRDEAYFVTSRLIDNSVKANIIWVQEPLDDTGMTLLRGRISQIDILSAMTLESFSEFNEPDWEYNNVPKTLTIDPTVTRVFNDGGRIDLYTFDDTGDNNYKNQTVYVLTQEGKAMLVSTAPFGDVVYKGRIFELAGEQKDSFGHIVVPASSFVLKDARCFDHASLMWEGEPEVQFSLESNTVYMKNEEIVDASQLREGDRVTVIKADTGSSAYIVLVESY